MQRFRIAKGFFGAAGSPLIEDGRVLANIGGRRGRGDTTTSHATLIAAAEQTDAVEPDGDGLEEVMATKGDPRAASRRRAVVTCWVIFGPADA